LTVVGVPAVSGDPFTVVGEPAVVVEGETAFLFSAEDCCADTVGAAGPARPTAADLPADAAPPPTAAPPPPTAPPAAAPAAPLADSTAVVNVTISPQAPMNRQILLCMPNHRRG
jgi:hypothetical protein